MPTNDLSKFQVLVADSNPHMLKVICAILRGFGINKIQEAADSTVAMQKLNRNFVDLMVLDFGLTTLSGVEMTKLLRKTKESPNRFVPIIMLSTETEKWRIEAARDAGATEFLRKPLSANDLYSRVSEIIVRPRPFVHGEEFNGPDRRRRIKPAPKNSERRTKKKPAKKQKSDV